jgi:DNA replication licensing factor MCM3
LLSRFDLLFVVTDDVEENRDRKISEHVLRMHRYLKPGHEEGKPINDSLDQSLSVEAPTEEDTHGETAMYEKFDSALHPGVATRRKREILSIHFLKKYIQYAKSRPAPVLTKGAADWIINVYSNLRSDDDLQNRKKVSPPY